MNRLLSIVLLLIALTSAASIQATDDSLDKQIDSIVKDIKNGDQHATEYRKVRQYHMLDIDGDGVKDTIVLFTIESFGGGNNYHFYMAVLRRIGEQFSFLDVIEIGREGRRHIDFNDVSIKDGNIVVGTREYVRDNQHFDPNCCPSKKGQATFEIKDGKLHELK